MINTETLIYKVKDEKSTYLVSDTHFDHKNIIKYCNRPFSSVEEMNEVILNNWKDTINDDDLVFFLGDMAFGRGSKKPKWWLSQLPGRIVYLKGSHDQGIRPTSTGLNAISVSLSVIMKVKGLKIYLVHDPINIPNDWDGWAIHGHNHNNRPFLDIDNKRINVSLDVTDFKPVKLDYILDIINLGL